MSFIKNSCQDAKWTANILATITDETKEDVRPYFEALQTVENEATKARGSGVSSLAFFFGLTTCVLTAYLIGAFPESVWIVYAAEAMIILGYRVYSDCQKKGTSTMYYFFDFCWVVNFCMASVAFIVLFQVVDDWYLGDLFPTLNLASQYPSLGRVFCLIATGPLGWSVIALKNALVLHDILHFSSCFIHLWPSLTTLCVRWSPMRVMAKYPGHFDSLVGFHDPESGAALLDLVKLGASTYFGKYACFNIRTLLFLTFSFFFAMIAAWWIVFTLWMVFHGRFQSPQKTGKDTVYLNLVIKNGKPTGIGSALGIVINDKEDALVSASRMGPVIKYMLAHAVAVQCTLIFSAFCYQNMKLHLAFCVLISCVALFNASKRYEWMLTDRYTVAMKKMIESKVSSKSKGKKGR
jgi:hypothetical protein|eukprot:Stramenopile-MAST_4_protein_953